MTGRRVVLGAVAVGACLLIAGRWGAALYTDYLWFDSLGASDVWRARIGITAVLEAGSFAAAFAFAFANIYAVRRSVVSLVLPRRIGNIEIGEEVPNRFLLLAVAALSALVGVAMLMPTEGWSEALLAQIGQPFGESDPYFGADLGFFVYWLPFETTLHYWSILLLVVVSGMVVLLYALTPSLRWSRGSLYVSSYVRRHLVILGAVILLILAWSFRLSMFRLLSSGAFTPIDHRVLVPTLLLLAVVTLCAALVVAWAGWTGQLRIAFLAVSTVLVLSVVGRSLAPLMARRSVEPSAAASQERAYLATRFGYTRRAYGVDRIRPETLGTGFHSALAAVPHLAVWDAPTLASAAQRLRRVRVVGDGAAWVPGDSGFTALLVEHSSDLSADARDAWGVRAFDVSEADERGMPVHDASSSEEALVPDPAVYDSAPTASVLSDSLRRLTGVEMVSTRSRLAHAWSLQNFRLLFGEVPIDRPIILRHRDVRDRIEQLAPFLTQGSEVVPLVARDSLYWVVELYSAADAYPLSQRFTVQGEERGYFQHAATALIHAASGRVTLVAPSAPDAIVTSWMVRFPGLFVPESALPEVLRAALPPIRDGARIQALAFGAAGFRGDSLEVRHFATPDGADSAASREPAHVALPVLGASVLWPMLDSQQRVRGMIAAGSGAQRLTAWIPVASDGLRWGAAVERLRSADSGRAGPVVRSPVRVAPVNGRAFYYQSSFQWRPGGSPTLLRVATLAGDTLRAAASMRAALGLGAASLPTTSPAPRDLRARADSLYRAMREALGRGDWIAFGRAFDALGIVLRPSIP